MIVTKNELAIFKDPIFQENGYSQVVIDRIQSQEIIIKHLMSHITDFEENMMLQDLVKFCRWEACGYKFLQNEKGEGMF